MAEENNSEEEVKEATPDTGAASSGSLFGYGFLGEDANTMLLFIMPPGAFLALAGLIVTVNHLRGAK